MPLYIWFPVLIGLGLGYAFMSIPPVADQFMHLFGVGYAGLSLLLSGLLWSHSFAQIPAGILVDRIGVFRSLIAASGIAVLVNIIPFAAPDNLPLAIAMRFVLGLTTGVLFLAVMKVLSILTPPGKISKAQGFCGGAFGFGTMFPYFTLPYLGEWGWGWSYLLTGAFFAATLACTLLLPREKLRQQQQALAKNSTGIGELVVRALKAPDLWMLGLMHGIFYGTLNVLGQWLPSVLADLAATPLQTWAPAATLALFVGSCSRTVSGYFLTLLSRKTAICLCLAAIAVLYAGLAAAGDARLGLAISLCLAVACGLCYGAIFTMGGLVLPPEYTGTSLGFVNSLGNLVNVGLTLAFGSLRDATGSFSSPLYLAGAAALLLLAAFRRRIARLDEQLK